LGKASQSVFTASCY